MSSTRHRHNVCTCCNIVLQIVTAYLSWSFGNRKNDTDLTFELLFEQLTAAQNCGITIQYQKHTTSTLYYESHKHTEVLTLSHNPSRDLLSCAGLEWYLLAATRPYRLFDNNCLYNKQRITTTNKIWFKVNRGGNRTEFKSKRTDTMVSFFCTMLI